MYVNNNLSHLDKSKLKFGYILAFYVEDRIM